MKTETIMYRIVYRNGDDGRACHSYQQERDSRLGIASESSMPDVLEALESEGMLRRIPYSHPAKYKVTAKGMEMAKEARNKAVVRANRPRKSLSVEETLGTAQNCACPGLTPSTESAIVAPSEGNTTKTTNLKEGTAMTKPETAPTSNVTDVLMEDGTTVQFSGRKKLIKSHTISGDGTIVVRLDFITGAVRLFTMPASMLLRFAAHGAEQKLGDEIAGIADMDDAVQAVDELIVRLNKGDWSSRREAGGNAGASILARALVELTGKTMDSIKEFLSSKSASEKLALRSSPKLQPIIARLEAEKASKSKKPMVDTDALLGELE